MGGGVLVPVYCMSGSVFMLVCIPKIFSLWIPCIPQHDVVYPVRIPKGMCCDRCVSQGLWFPQLYTRHQIWGSPSPETPPPPVHPTMTLDSPPRPHMQLHKPQQPSVGLHSPTLLTALNQPQQRCAARGIALFSLHTNGSLVPRDGAFCGDLVAGERSAPNAAIPNIPFVCEMRCGGQGWVDLPS